MLELGRPADWAALAAVWRGVQTDLGWPAPAIAVNGHDAYQLWMCTASPVPVAQARSVLLALCRRYLPDVPAHRLRWWPDADPLPGPLAQPVPSLDEVRGVWSAFVAPDLAPVFEDSPWLDLPPSVDGQADLLWRLQPLTAAHLAAMGPMTPQEVVPIEVQATPMALADAVPEPELQPGGLEGPTPHQAEAAARAFLLSVMHDPAVDLTLRIDAAGALLGGKRP